MRKILALAAVAALVSIVPSTPAAAAVINPDDGTCNARVPDGEGGFVGPDLLGSAVIRDNKSWTTMTCHFDIPDEFIPPKARHTRNFPCGIIVPDDVSGDATIVQADETRLSASAGGRMVMTCRLRKS